MRIAVVGAGVAGSYLLNRLEGHDVECFEQRPQDKWYTVCAWGTSRPFITSLVKKVGLNFDDYVLHTGDKMIVDYGTGSFAAPLKGLVTYDKHRLCEDMLKGHKVHWGTQVKTLDGRFDDFDLVVDATGMPRSLLPKIKGDILVPCLEYQLKSDKFPWEDFYIKPYRGMRGYFWFFPLGDGMAHVGAGEINGAYKGELEAFVKKYDCQVIRKIGRPVRIVPPAYSGPFYVDGRCKKCGGKLRLSTAPRNIESAVGSGAGRKGRNSGRSGFESSKSSETNAMYVAAQTNSSYTTRSAVQLYSDTPTIVTPEGSASRLSDKPSDIPVGSHLSAQAATSGSPGINFTQSSEKSYCNCQEPYPDRPPVVGVGESIGTVYPMLGEGIIPSMQCVDILVENLHDLERYSEEVLKHYDIYAKVFRFVKAKIDGNFSLVRNFPELFSIFMHMRSNTERYGLETHLSDMIKLSHV